MFYERKLLEKCSLIAFVVAFCMQPFWMNLTQHNLKQFTKPPFLHSTVEKFAKLHDQVSQVDQYLECLSLTFPSEEKMIFTFPMVHHG